MTMRRPLVKAWNHQENPEKNFRNHQNFEKRPVGEKKTFPWKNKSWISCGWGFNIRSNTAQCCDQFVHSKASCLKDTPESDCSFCKVCCPQVEATSSSVQQKHACITRNLKGFKCDKCGLVLKTKFSAQRLIQIMHCVEEEFVVEETDTVHDEKQIELKDILLNIDLGRYTALFDNENINLEMRTNLNEEEFM